MTTVITGFTAPDLASGGAYQLASMTELLAELRVRLRDPSASSGRFTDTELYACIKSAIRTLSGQVRTVGSLATTFTSNERDYDLPAYVLRILAVRRGPLGDVLTLNEGRLVPVLSYRHLRTPLSNTLHFENTYMAGLALEVDFTMGLSVPPIPAELETGIDSDDLSIDISGASEVWPVPGYGRMGSELVAWDGQSGGILTGMTRGLFGTTAAAHLAAVSVDPVLPVDPSVREAVILGAIVEAHRMRLEDGPSSDTPSELTRYQAAKQMFMDAQNDIITDIPPAQIPVWRNSRRRGPVVR